MRFFSRLEKPSEWFRRISQHKRLIAIVVGVVLAGAPLIAFDAWLSDLVEREGREDATNLAKRTLTLSETRIARAQVALAMLAERGINSCSPAHLAWMQETVFAVTPVKDIQVVSATGEVLCSHFGSSLGTVEMLSSERMSTLGETLLEVVRVGTPGERYVRVRRIDPADQTGLAALIPADLFVPLSSSQGSLFTQNARLLSPTGSVLAETPGMTNNVNPAEVFIGTAYSPTTGLQSLVMTSRAKPSPYRDLSKIGLFVPAAIAILVILFAVIVPRRQLQNPITELRDAIEAGEFVPYYQPVVDIRSGKLLGAEVLLRWRKPDGTLVSPGSFIPLAESSGLIVELTLDLMRRVCAGAGQAIGRRPGFKISFNFTATLFANRNIVRDVRRIFADSPIDMSQVVIEVTERDPIVDLTATRQVIAAFQGLGARVAIDDVGTGHSGLSYMLKLGVDIIKIDKMFVDAIGTDRKSSTIVETLVDLAHNMRMDIVAEGVENFEQVALLREMGIRAAQGFVFAPPLPGSAFLQLMESIDPRPEEASPPAKPRRYISARQNYAS